MTKVKKSDLRKITVTAIMSAIAAILQFVEFSIPIIPSFVKLDFSDLPALITSFAIGPWYGVTVELIKNLLHLPFGSSASVGEICNFLLGSVFCITAGFIYKKHKTRKGAVIGVFLGALFMALASLPMNYFIVYPAYVVLYHMPMDAIIGMYSEILPGTDSLAKALTIFNLPFTFLKGIANAIICFLIYKPLSPVIKGKNV